MSRLETIRELGVIVNHDQEYFGPVPRQHRDRPDTVENVWIGDVVTPDEWVRATQREGADYIGPCCGNTGYCQDVLAGVYRDGGLISRGDLLGIGINLGGHDGYEEFADDSDEAFEKLVGQWKSGVFRGDTGFAHPFGVWEKILTVYRALEPMLFPVSYDRPSPEFSRDDDAYGEREIRLLDGALAQASWHSMFTPMEGDKEGHALQYVEQLARIAPMAARLHDELTKQQIALDGFALVEPGTDKVMSNRMGLCVYGSRERADYWNELMHRAQVEAEGSEHGKPETMVMPEVVPIHVSVDGGLEVRRD